MRNSKILVKVNKLVKNIIIIRWDFMKDFLYIFNLLVYNILFIKIFVINIL